MKTHFAPAERTAPDKLQEEVKDVSNNEVVDCILKAASGLIAVLDKNRQVVAINQAMMDMLGISDPGPTLGLRLGEVVACIHAHDMPGGCGTSKACRTCGAAIAMVACAKDRSVHEEFCSVTMAHGESARDLFLKVRSFPITLGDNEMIMLFLQDQTQAQRWADIESAFLHDINNIICGILCNAELMAIKCSEGDMKDQARQLVKLSERLSDEVNIQRELSRQNPEYNPYKTELTAKSIITETYRNFSNHKAAKDRHMAIEPFDPKITVNTDRSLLLRILENMIKNALEATEAGGEIRISVEKEEGSAIFSVWNRSHIDEDIAERIFQRNFSTKGAYGRGIGTYAMKLFGEKILGGKVYFESDEDNGTTFHFSLPESVR
ncbi:MAG: GHKL domain-containing protein [Planctomycetes bacterium]|nr:GHKL domain-containing protein [Planctomycetota bacterium]